jgi:uncharacterized FlaG/YvyC family protein
MDKIIIPCSAKILPLTYDDSLSYYEQLCKLTNKMNELVNFVNGEISTTIQNYLDQHFNDIMINAIYDESTETIILEKETK